MKVFNLPTQADYPKKIHFGMEVYTIRFVKKLDCYGETDPVKHTIRLKDGMSPRMIFTTLIHELLHVIEFEHPVTISHAMVYKLEQAIVEMLLDNFM